MKKVLSAILALTLTFSLFGCGASETETQPTTTPEEVTEQTPETPEVDITEIYDFVRIGTASLGGNFYNWGSAIAQMINDKMGCNASSQATNGSSENCYLVTDGEVEIGLSQGNSLYDAVTSRGSFEGEDFSNLRALGIIGFNVYHVLIRTNAGINNISDLKGKRIAMGPIGGGVETSARKWLSFYGIEDGDFTPIYGTVAEMHEQLKNGQIDAYVNAVAAGTAQTADTMSDSKITLLTMDNADVDAYIAENPDVGAFTIPAGTYEGQSEDYYTMGQAVIMFADESMPDEFAYAFTKTFYENYDYLMGYNSGFSDATLENCQVGLCLPLHPGSEAYLKEVNALK